MPVEMLTVSLMRIITINVNSLYSWNFFDSDEIYPFVEEIKIGMPWNIPVAYPDHAMMISNIKINS